MAAQCETSSQGITISSGADDDILISREVGGLSQVNRDGSKSKKPLKDYDDLWIMISYIARVKTAFIASSPHTLDPCAIKKDTDV